MYAFRVFPETTLYKTRAIGGLHWLLSKQLADGSFLDYITDTTQVDRTDAAIAGSAFLMGYQEFRDAAYLTAATKVANWLKGGGCDPTGCFQPGLTDLPPNPPSFYRPIQSRHRSEPDTRARISERRTHLGIRTAIRRLVLLWIITLPT
jgi:hypothetical protein